MRAEFIILLLAAAAAVVIDAQTNQCHYDCYNFKGSVSDGESLKRQAVSSCKAQNVAGNPTFVNGSSYFQTNANAAAEEGCTFSVCTPFMGAGYGTNYVYCEHNTSAWMALTASVNTTSTAARANANVTCTACPSA